MGLNLHQYQLNGQLTVLEPPTVQPDEQPPQPTMGAGAAGSPPPGEGPAATACGSRLQQLQAAVRRALEQRPAAAAGVAVLLDSLTVLAALGASKQEWAAFLHYCCASSPPQQQQQQQVPYCVVAGVYGDVPDDRLWLTSLEHRADVVVSVAPLPGRIADVDGLVTVTRRCASDPRSCRMDGDGEPGPWLGAPASSGSLHQSLYFRSTELAIKWMDHVTARELL